MCANKTVGTQSLLSSPTGTWPPTGMGGFLSWFEHGVYISKNWTLRLNSQVGHVLTGAKPLSRKAEAQL